MSLVCAVVVHVARADLTAVASGVGDGDGAIVGVADGASIGPAEGVAADPQAKTTMAMQLNTRVCLMTTIPDSVGATCGRS